MSNVLGGPGGTGPADNRPLTDQEYQLVQRLLSDPLSFPLEFKAWLVAYLESSDLTLPMNAILGLQKTLGITGAGAGTLGIFPAGIILPYGGDFPPVGAFLCDGAAYPKASEGRLYAAIGTKYGGDATTFNVPDLQGRVPVGKGTHPDVATVGGSDGLALASRTPRHTTSIPGSTDGSVSSGTGLGNVVLTDHPVSGAANPNLGGARPADTPAFQVVNFIIVK